MSRGLWFVAGAGAGVYAVIRGRRAAEVFTVDGLTDRINGAAHGLRLLRDEVAQGRVEKETELRARLAALPDSRPRPAALGSPTGSTTTDLPAPPTHHDTEEGSS